MKKIFLFVLLLSVLSVAQSNSSKLAVWLTTSSVLSKDECKFLSEIIREGAENDLSGSMTVVKGKKSPADYHVESNVSKMGSWFHITVELYQSNGAQLLNSYSERSKDIDMVIENLQSAMSGFFNAVQNVGEESFESETIPSNEDNLQDISGSTDEESIMENQEAASAENAVEEPSPVIEIDFSNVQYQDDGKSGVLTPNGEDPGYSNYDKFVWSSVVTLGMDDDAKGSSGSRQIPLSYPMIRLGLSASVTYNDFWGSSLGLDDLDGDHDGYSIETKGADDLLHNYWGIGFDAGLGFLFMLNPNFGLHVEAAFGLRQGSGKSNMSVFLKWDDSDRKTESDDLEIEYSTSQMNIDMPIMARLAIPDVIYVEAGIMTSLCIQSEMEATIDSYWGRTPYSESDFNNFFELGLVAGLGVMKHIGSKALDLNFRFVLGLTSLSSEDASPKTMQVQFNTTFWFM